MSSLAAILDAAAAKVAAIPGLRGASGAGVTAGVAPMPGELPDTPYAVGFIGSGTASQGTLTRFDDELEFRIYVPLAALPGAYALLLEFPARFDLAWRTDRRLGGTCTDSSYVGHGEVGLETWGGVDYLFMPIQIRVIWVAAANLSP